MNDAQQVSRIAQSIEIDVAATRVFEVLTDPNNIPRYAAGIESAEVLEIPNGPDSLTGARLELVTKSSNILRAEVLESVPPKRLVVRDERGVTSSWIIEPLSTGRVRLDNVIEGVLTPAKAQSLQYDCDVKFQALQTILEDAPESSDE